MLEEVTPGEEDNMPYKVGVLNVNLDTPTQAPDEGWQDDDNLTEHFLGVILVLFGGGVDHRESWGNSLQC